MPGHPDPASSAMLPPHARILTKIVATLGPSSGEADTIARLIEEGVRVVRINFSHGNPAEFTRLLEAVREASRRTDIPVAAMGDLAGPKIRLAPVEGGRLDLRRGERVELVEQGESVRRRPDGVIEMPTTHPPLVREAAPGQRVLIDDGAVRMLAVELLDRDGPPRLVCRVTGGGPIRDRKGVNLPETDLAVPSLTDYDLQCVDWAVSHGVDYLALSFIRRADDVRRLREHLHARPDSPEAGRPRRRGHEYPPIIAKIEKPQAIHELEEILDASDAVMVARGDLGVEMDLAEVPLLQKRIVRRARAHGKPAIVATQMLQSMIHASQPTRAEVSDVANAVLDGADGLMLSGETAVGEYPVQAVRAMARAADTAEHYAGESRPLESSTPTPPNPGPSASAQTGSDGGAAIAPIGPGGGRYRTAALAHGVSTVVRDLKAKYIVIWSELGGGARYLSRDRVDVPLIGVSSRDRSCRAMNLLFGVTPVSMSLPQTSESFTHAVDRLLLSRGWARPGDAVVLVLGEPLGTPGVTSGLRIHYLGDVCRL